MKKIKPIKSTVDAVLIFINAFLSLHNKTVSKEELLYILTTFQTAIKNGLIKAKHPLSAVANATQNKLVALINKLSPNEKVILIISNKKIIENKISSLQGLGFWNVIASAVIGKAAEHLVHKHLTKNNVQGLSGIDEDVLDELANLYENLNPNKVVNLGKISKNSVQKIKQASEIDFTNFTVIARGKEAIHVNKMHNKDFEKVSGQVPVTTDKFILHSYVVMAPDEVEYQKENNTILFYKQIGQHYYVVQEILSDNKTMRLKTMWIKKQKKPLKQSLSGFVSISTYAAKAPKYKRPKRLVDEVNIQKKSKQNNLSGVMSVTDAINSKYDLIGLDGDYLKLIGEACKPTSFFIYGPGGSGKSSFTLLFSNYMAKKGNKMLYVAGEQFATPVFSKMLQRLKIEDSPNFVIVKSIETVPLKGFDFIVIDSKDSLNFELNDFITLKKNNPNLSFVILSQATKDGGFTGSEKWRNEVDTLLYCEDLIVHSNLDKNRWGGSAQFSILKIK